MKLDKYEQMRSTNSIDIDWCFEYYLENGGKVRDKNQFQELFLYEEIPIVVGGRNFGTQRQPRQFFENFFNDLDSKLGITTLHAPLTEQEIQAKKSVGNFIKIVE